MAVKGVEDYIEAIVHFVDLFLEGGGLLLSFIHLFLEFVILIVFFNHQFFVIGLLIVSHLLILQFYRWKGVWGLKLGFGWLKEEVKIEFLIFSLLNWYFGSGFSFQFCSFLLLLFLGGLFVGSADGFDLRDVETEIHDIEALLGVGEMFLDAIFHHFFHVLSDGVLKLVWFFRHDDSIIFYFSLLVVLVAIEFQIGFAVPSASGSDLPNLDLNFRVRILSSDVFPLERGGAFMAAGLVMNGFGDNIGEDIWGIVVGDIDLRGLLYHFVDDKLSEWKGRYVIFCLFLWFLLKASRLRGSSLL